MTETKPRPLEISEAGEITKNARRLLAKWTPRQIAEALDEMLGLRNGKHRDARVFGKCLDILLDEGIDVDRKLEELT